MSLFHVFSVLAASARHDGVSLIEIHLLPGLNGRYCLPEMNFAFEGAHVLIKHNANQPGRSSQYVKLILPFLGYILLGAWNSKPKTILMHHTYLKPNIFLSSSFREALSLWVTSFEEGVGTYGDLRHHREVARIEKKKLPTVNYFLKKALSFLVREKFSVLTACKPSDAIAFRKAVHTISAQTGLNGSQFMEQSGHIANASRKKKLIFFGSPYMDRQGISKKKYKEYVNRFILENPDFVFFVKPHPLEKKSLPVYEELGVPVIDHTIGGEMLVALLEPALIIGFYSGVLLAARNIYGTPYRIADPAALGDSSSLEGSISPSIMKLYEKQ